MGELVQGRSKYSDEDRRRAVVEFCTNGVMTRVSDATGIANTTLTHWKNKSDWWDGLVAQVRNEIGEQILAQNMEIASKAGELVLDSLKNGDEKLVIFWHHFSGTPSTAPSRSAYSRWTRSSS